MDYYDVIKKPMDFDTLKKNLLDSKYTTYEEFLLDIQLIWDNCKLYNQAGTPIVKMCDRLERMTKKEIGKWKSQNSLQAVVVPNSGATRPPPAPRTQGKRNNSQRQATTSSGPPKESVEPKEDVDMKETELESTDVTRNMKLEFVSKIKKLTNEGLTSVVEKIREIRGTSISELPDDKIQIRVDDFEKGEFDTLTTFVENLIVENLPSKKQKTQ